MIKLSTPSRNISSQATWWVIGQKRANIDCVQWAEGCCSHRALTFGRKTSQSPQAVEGSRKVEHGWAKNRCLLTTAIRSRPATALAGGGEELSCLQSVQGLKAEWLKSLVCPLSLDCGGEEAAAIQDGRSLPLNDTSTSYNNTDRRETPSDFSGMFEACRCKTHESVIRERGQTLSSFAVMVSAPTAVSKGNTGKANWDPNKESIFINMWSQHQCGANWRGATPRM